MAVNFLLQALRRGGDYAAQPVTVRANEYDELLVAQGSPAYTDAIRRGQGWSVQTATPFAPGVALPTTLANLELANGTTDKLMIVDRVWMWQLLGTAAVQGHTVWAQVGATVQSAITGLVVYSANGSTSYTSAAGKPIQTALTQTVTAAGWQPFATQTVALLAATPGAAAIGNVEGRLIVPPGKALHLMVEGSLATASSVHVGASVILQSFTNETT